MRSLFFRLIVENGKGGWMVEQFVLNGQAFLPVNVANKGDCMHMYWKDGTIEQMDERSETFLAKILHHFGTSVTVNRNRYGQLVGKKQLVPIVLSYGITLIPFNVRETIGRQTKIGWFIAKEIATIVKQHRQETIIRLAQHDITVQHSEKFCFEQLKNARCMELCYGEIHEPFRKNWLFSVG